MKNIIQQWIQDRLGVLINMSPELFAQTVKDGYILSEVLRTYEIITEDQLQMIEKSNLPTICLDNFRNHINGWLRQLDVHVKDEDLLEIINSKGTAALNLFYQVYLELNAKTNLHFVAKQRLNEKLHMASSRFTVTEVKKALVEALPAPRCRYGAPIERAYDIMHWQQDHLETLKNKCREAREEYMEYIRRQSSSPSDCPVPPPKIDTVESKLDTRLEEAVSVDLTYGELIEQQMRAKDMDQFVPDPQESQRILKKFRMKQRRHDENDIFKRELQREILAAFWDRVNQNEEDSFNKNITEALLKQSLYEKQMLQKLGEVKLQKEVMLENQQILNDAIAKQKEADFVEYLVLKDKELDEKEFTYYLEKERALELHRRIYEEKLRLKAERHYNMCMDAFKDIVNAALKEIEYKKEFGEEPTRRVRDSWKKMFVAGVPFYDYVTPLESIVKKCEDDEDTEEIIHLEIDRQDRIDEKDFESYMTYEWPWELDNIEIDEENSYEMNCGLNVLGNVVHNLLVVKYPYPPLPQKPDLPNITISACVNGLPDTACLPLLQKILDERQVLVVEIQDAVNFCISAYKEEIKVEVEDVEEDDKSKKKGKGKDKGKKEAKPKKEPKSKKGEKSKFKGKGSKGKSDQEPAVEVFEKVDKTVQTPRVYPCEEIPLTAKADLGKIAHEELAAGEPLTDYLLVAMFVEYLKAKPEIKGWVLINYPSTYIEAALLEEGLTGLAVPGADKLQTCKSIYEMADLDRKFEETPVDENEEFRTSKLLPNPVARPEPEFYDTALTAYIKAKLADEDTDGFDQLPEHEELEEEPDPLDRFYSDLGCNYSFYYKKFDFNTVKYLAKLVIGDFSLPIKTSVEIFGDSIRYINAGLGTGGKKSAKSSQVGEKKEKPKEKPPKAKSEDTEDTGKKGKGKKGKEDKKGKGGKGKNKAPILIVHEDKWTQMPEEEEIIEEIVEPQEPPKAGEPGWEYTNLPFPEELQIACATFWENAEEVYVEDFGQVFFLKRIILNAIMPFVNYVKEYMTTYITRPDDKQIYLREFQRTYNEFDDDIRNDEEFKAELHCRINEMREKLFEICDRRMMEAEHERGMLIGKKWAPKQFTELVNDYISGFQLELDRYVDSLTVLGDYYTAVVTKMPNEETIPKEPLPKIDIDNDRIAEAVNKLLEFVDSDPEELPIKQMVEEVSEMALAFIEKTQGVAEAIFKKVKAIFAPEGGKGKKKPPKPKGDKKKGQNILTLFEPDDTVKQNTDKILEEWTCAIKGETARVVLRLDLLKMDLFMNLDEIINTTQKTFHGIYEEIRTRYENEVTSVKNSCEVLTRAVEKEVQIQQELFLKDDNFFIDPDSILFTDKIPPAKLLTEYERAEVFTISELDKITDVLLDLAPSGYMPQRCFLYLLQDLIVTEDGPITVPEMWRQLKPNDVVRILQQLFDDIEYVQWKEFILYNFMIPFPDEDELFAMRREFREFDPDSRELITEYQFLGTKLWFEYEGTEEEEIRIKAMKHLLCKLYRVRTDRLNYTAMLLDLSKDVNPIIGLAKALGVSLGKPVCWNKEIGVQYAEETLTRRRIHEERVRKRNEERQEAIDTADAVLDELIDHTVHVCDSVVIDDIFPEEDILQEFMEEYPEDLPIEEYMTEEQEGEYEAMGEYLEEQSSGYDFSNTAISFEVEPAPALAYFLPFDVLIAVITTALPWHAKVQNVEDKSFREMVEEIYEECRNSEFNFDVLAHEFLNHPRLLQLLSTTSKFSVKVPAEIVENIITEREKENESENGL